MNLSEIIKFSYGREAKHGGETMKIKTKSFEVKIKTTIIFSTFDFADDYDTEVSINELLEDLFEESGIKLKQDKNKMTDLEVLDFKKTGEESFPEKKRGGCNP